MSGALLGWAIRLIETGAATGPLAFGIFRRYVAVPRDFTDRFDRAERDRALAHELGHHARGDLIANWIALLVLALHWFDPIAWRAFRAYRADQEIANDARVLAGRAGMARHDYASAIVKSAHPALLRGTVAATCRLHAIDDLKGRLKMLTTRPPSRRRLVAGAGALALLSIAGLGATASGSRAAERVRGTVRTATGVDIAAPSVAVPVVPPAPAIPPVHAAMQTEPVAPPAPPALAGSGSAIHIRRIVRTGRDGQDTVIDLPDVGSKACGDDGSQHDPVIDEQHGAHRRIVVCTDRIEKTAAESAAFAANSAAIERDAYRSALNGLRDARPGIAADTTMGAKDRAEALDAIDSSIREIEQDLAKAD